MNTLAIAGGTPLRTTPMPRWPAPGEAEIEAVTEVLRTGRLNYWTGPNGNAFEAEYAEAIGRTHAVAVANGTLAIELALRALGVGAGDEVIVPARTFLATASAAVAVGATPVIADIETTSGNLTVETVESAMTERTRAVIPVHVGGWPVDMEPLVALARRHDVLVIEDCAQAHGATYRGTPVGSLGSHAAAFSFCQDKNLPVGDGGMVFFDDEAVYQRAWSYKDHGKSLARVREAQAADTGSCFKWQVESFGTNWRLDEMSAALGRVGLRRLPEWHAARTRNALRLARALEGVPGMHVPLPGAEIEHGFYRLYAVVEPERLKDGWDRDAIVRAIQAEGVPCQYGTCAEIYRERAFAAAGLGPEGRLPGAEQVHETFMAFFVHPTLDEQAIDDTARAVVKVMEVAAR